MRNDFQKLLCECYKEGRAYATSSGSIRRRKKRMQTDQDGYPSHVSEDKMRDSSKFFGENLAPLKRYIAKQVGRPWNKVYSEICKHNSKAGAVGLHIFQHLYQYIEVRVEKDDKRVYYPPDRYRGRHEIPHGLLYVDPDDNIIKKYRKNNKKSTKKIPKHFLRIDALHTIELEQGIWYAYTWQETPRDVYVRSGRRGRVFYYQQKYCQRRQRQVAFPEAKVFATQKRQLDRRELKKHNITNHIVY